MSFDNLEDIMSNRMVIFASGTGTGGGSGAANLVKACRDGVLSANIVAFVSNHETGGVRRHAQELGVPFLYFPGSYDVGEYRRIVRWLNVNFVALSGWLKLVKGLDPKTCFNIHSGILPDFGGPGMYGHHVHEATMKAFHEGRVAHSAVSMHFVTENYDDGPVFFRHPIRIEPNDTADTLAQRVNKAEHEFQPTVTEMVVRGLISWDGKNRDSLRVPPSCSFLPKGVCK